MKMDLPLRKRRKLESAETPDDERSSDESSASDSDSNPDIFTKSPATTPSSRSPSKARPPSDRNKTCLCTFTGCTKAFNRPAKLEQHLRSHLNIRPFICTYTPCDKAFLRGSHLKHHIKATHTLERDHACIWPGCEKRFLTGTRLRRHIEAHEGQQRFVCGVVGCGLAFRKHNTLQAHTIKVHEGRKPYVCAFLNDNGKKCNHGFDTAGKLRDHEGRMHRIKRYVCEQCSGVVVNEDETLVAFTTYSALQEHLAVQHPPVCNLCGLECASQANLRSHIEVRHANLTLDQRRTLKCPHDGCAAAFTKKGNLKVHEQAVHGSRRFICDTVSVDNFTGTVLAEWDGHGACGACFTSKAKLIQHVRRAHLESASTSTATSTSIKAPKKQNKKRQREAKKRKKAAEELTKLTGAGAARIEDGTEHMMEHEGEHHDVWDDDPDHGHTYEPAYADADAEDDQFWLGGDDETAAQSQWLQDEMEIYRLIHDGDADGDIHGQHLDPALM